MTPPTSSTYPRTGELLSQAWPIIAANAAVPTLGLVDTAVIGHFGSVDELAALAMASLIFSFVYWCFGFLRMGTTGFVARAQGAGDETTSMRVVLQSAILAGAISFCLMIFQNLILLVSVHALSAPAQVLNPVSEYFHIRIWGAPATLLNYVATGILIGLGDGRRVMYLQLFLNVANAMLDIILAGVINLGIQGIALGTVLAEYATLVLALFVIAGRFFWAEYLRSFRVAHCFVGASELLSQNRDLFIRTLFLLLGFAFFTRTSAEFGTVTLAANHILLQFITFAAFFMDGYAHVLESHTGHAVGRKCPSYFKAVLKKTSLLSFVSALFLALSLLFFSNTWFTLLTNKVEVIVHAQDFIYFVALYVLVSVGAYQLDGAFIGAGASKAMRNCSIISTLVLILAWFVFFRTYGAKGLWMAFVLYVFIRGFSLYLCLSNLQRRCIE